MRTLGSSNGEPAVFISLFRQPGANIIKTIDHVKAELPHLEAAMPADINVRVAIDLSTTIRASLHDAIRLVIAIGLVTLVVYLFLGNIRATLIASITRRRFRLSAPSAPCISDSPRLDILSLMALTVATGFVVDDAFVVLENISRHVEAGMPRLQAALRGAQDVGFTVLSISLSLIAVFIPILLMGGGLLAGCSANSPSRCRLPSSFRWWFR